MRREHSTIASLDALICLTSVETKRPEDPNAREKLGDLAIISSHGLWMVRIVCKVVFRKKSAFTVTMTIKTRQIIIHNNVPKKYIVTYKFDNINRLYQ